MKAKNTSLFVIAALLLSCTLYGQVRLQTGTAEFSLPMYSYADNNSRLTTDISLVYKNGNGLKVNEIASAVGTGWDLEAGGYIRRIQNGEPDDQENYDSYTYPFLPNSDPQSAFWTWAKNYYPDGFLRSQFTSSDLIRNEGVYTPMYGYPYKYYKPKQKYSDDREQDLFEFSFNGGAGFFMISRPDGNGISTIRTLYDSKLKIEKVEGDLNNNQNIRTTISKFIITDESGIKYYFEEADLDQVVDYESASEYNAYTPVSGGSTTVTNINIDIPEPKLRVNKATTRNSFVKNKWYLTKIENPLTNTSIIFQYETYTVDINTQKNIQRTVGNNRDQTSLTQGRSVSQLKRLTKIILNANEVVEFQYASTNRIDLPTDKTLDRVNIKYGTEVKYRWDFTYGYFVKTDIKSPTYNFTTEDKTWARLCLLGIGKSGGGINEPPYTFDYYRGNEGGLNSAVPPMFSSQQNLGGYYSTTNFGFYNPTTQTTSISHPPYEPNKDEVLPRAFYKSIVEGQSYDPTLSFVTGATVGPTIEARNGILKTVKNPVGGELQFEYEMNQVGPAPNYFYGVRVNKTIVYDGINHSNDKSTEYKYINSNNSSSGWGAENYTNHQTTTIGFRNGCSGGERPLNQIYSVAKPIANFLLISTGIIPGTITFYNIGGSMVPAFALQYFGYILFNILEGFFSNPPEVTYDVSTVTLYINQPLHSNLLPFQYSRIEVIDKLGVATNGKTVHEFTSPASGASYAIDYPTMAKPYSGKQRFAAWLYGLPEKITVIDNNAHTVKKIVNSYTPIKTVLTSEQYKSQKWIPLENDYGCGFLALADDLNSSTKISTEIYSPITGRIELNSTEEYTYDANNVSAITTTNYSYSAGNYLPNKVTTTNSRNEVMETYTWFPSDYTVSGPLQSMISNNMYNVPVATQSLVTKNGNTYATGGNVTDFQVISNGDIRPLKSYALQSVQPVLKSSVDFSAAALIPNTQYYKEQQLINYNSTGMPKEIVSNGRKTGKLFGYNNKFLIADITNGTGDQAFFDSFEEGGVWDAINYDNVKVHNGKRSGRIDNLEVGVKVANGKWIDVSLTQPTTFRYSGWVYSEHPETEIILCTQTAGGSTVTADFAYTTQVNQWVFLEKEVTIPANVTKIFVRVLNRGAWDLSGYGGSVWFDDIRIHPANARMVTYTYDPIFGLTSQTDPNNRSVRYEYDGLGRLSHLIDNDGNILKKYCYNYAGQPESCPVVSVGNQLKTRVFTKNDCNGVAGFYGTQVTYTVPTDKYFGFTQTSANNLADAEIDREGQAYANLNGTCLAGQANDAMSQVFTRNNCAATGRVGTQVTYSVPFGKYAAATKPAANALASQDIIDNGQAYANANGYCWYANTAINANYYSQACAANQTPVAYPVTVAAGLYFSSYSQENANYQASNDAQQQANLNGTCANGATQVYARLEAGISHYSSEYEPYGEGTFYNYGVQISLYLRFYSDAGCTTPYAITTNTSYSINASGFWETESSYTPYSGVIAFQGVATPGTTEIFFDDIINFEYLWGATDAMGDWLFLEKGSDSYVLATVGAGAIIATPIEVIHTNGF